MLTLMIFMFSSFAADSKSMAYVICKNRSFVRTIQVDWQEDEQACVTTYTKNGKPREVASAKNRNNCRGVINNIKENLTDAGWKCRDVSKQVHVISPE